MSSLARFSTLAACVLFSGALQLSAVDVLTTADGARLTGTILSISNGEIEFETAYAGVIKVKQTNVVSLETETPVSIRLKSGDVLTGPVTVDESKNITVTSTEGKITTNAQEVRAAWPTTARDPEEIAREKAEDALKRKWSYQVGADVSGKDGNTVKNDVGLVAQAKLEGPSDRLLFYGSYSYSKSQDLTGATYTSAREIKGGVDFTSYLSTHWGWYLRSEGEVDKIEGIDFRSTSAGGANYRAIKTDTMLLEGRAGAGYRYEAYTVPNPDPSDSKPGLEFALNFDWQFAQWGKLTSHWVFTPAFEDFQDYLISQDTGVDMPLKFTDWWVLRLGISNQYNNMPQPGKEEMDTTYYARLLLTWE